MAVVHLCVSCFNVSVNVCTRVILIVLSASVYHSFVLAEVLLNGYNNLYPPYCEKAVGKFQDVGVSVINGFLRIASIKSTMMHVVLRRFLRFLVSLLAIIVYPLTAVINLKRNKKCPPPTNPLLFKSATTIAHMIRNKEITSEEVVSAYIERCKEVNPYLNAIVEPRYEVALKEARGIDKMIANMDKKPELLANEYPLLGVPITVKESLAVEGMSNDCGTVYPYRNPAKTDAAIVRLARSAGAIPIAVTNTPQLCMNWETYNNVTGVTMNPYDQKRTTGGSSGGESALISSAASIIGLGSDIAGSLRLPPMFTGIFGHKPSPRLLSVEGHVPDCLDETFEEYFAVGPIVRYAEDLPLLLKVLKQPGSPDIPFDKHIDISKLKVYYMEGDDSCVTDSIGSDVRKAMQKARDYLKETHNIEVEKLKIKNIQHIWEISVRVLFKINHVRNIYTHPEKREELISLWPEVVKKFLGMSNHSFTCVAYGPLQQFFNSLPKGYYEKLLKVFEDIKSEFEKALSNDAVLLYPAFPYPADLHYRTYYKFLNCGYLTIFNVLGLPVTSCPIDRTSKGLPVGLQIAANRNQDHLTIALAKEFERAFGGWSPPNMELISEVKTA